MTEEHIHSVFENLIALLRDREAAVINEVGSLSHQKEKELQLQKDDLEFFLSGIRHSVSFGEVLLTQGGNTEIVASHQQVTARLSTLLEEGERVVKKPVRGVKLNFQGLERDRQHW